MEIKNLITFMRVAELGSFTKTAQILGYSQSTISFQIKQLEEELDCLLFERINHAISLTAKGKEVLEYAQQITRITNEFKETFSNESIKGHVHIVTPDSVCENMMQKNYFDFYKKYPDISVKFSTGDTHDMIQILNHNEADAIITLDSHIYNKDYIIAKEECVNMHFVTNSKSSLKNKKLTIKDILNEPFILTEKHMGYRRVLDEKLASMSLAIHPILEIGRTDLIVDVLRQQNFISFLPDFVCDPWIKEGKLIYLNVSDFKVDVWKQLIYHKNKWLSKPLEIFIDYIKENEFK